VGFAADRQVGLAIVCWYLHEAVTALAVEAPDLHQALADRHAEATSADNVGGRGRWTGRCGRRGAVVGGERRLACSLLEQ
jgi:hypothetical protein